MGAEILIDQRFEDKQLHVTLPLILFLVGIFACGISLFSPAVKHGKILSGLELNAISTILAFLGSSQGETSSERTLMCRVLLIANVCAPLMLLLGSRLFKGVPYFGYVVFAVLTLCVLFLLTVPYSEIESVYWGYFVWLAGLVLIALSGLLNLCFGK